MQARTSVRFAVQKSGRLCDGSLKLLDQWGVNAKRDGKDQLVVASPDGKFEILFVRSGDVPQYVQNGAADFGITGRNVIIEKKFDVNSLLDFDFAVCKLVIAVPDKSAFNNISDLEGERIATSYPNSLKKFLKKCGISAAIVEIQGSVEAAPELGLADAICDLVQTGKTLKAHNLRVVEEIYTSNAILIESPYMTDSAKKFKESVL
jgi:ATP phosphoribosyltransferase